MFLYFGIYLKTERNSLIKYNTAPVLETVPVVVIPHSGENTVAYRFWGSQPIIAEKDRWRGPVKGSGSIGQTVPTVAEEEVGNTAETAGVL